MPSNKQNSLIPLLIAFLGFVVGMLYNGQTDPAIDVPPIETRFQLTSLQGLRDVRIDDSVLMSAQFKALRVFGSLPVVPGSGGKSDPFQ